MTGLYFSGTGNTRWCATQFLTALDGSAALCPIEDAGAEAQLAQAQDILLAYPVYYSNLPKIVRDFITKNAAHWKGKRVFVLATMGLFSGDGAGVSARLLRRYGAEIVGGLHVHMPDCIADEKALKRPMEKNRQIVQQAAQKIAQAAAQVRAGTPPREGLGIWCHLAGLFGQRLYFSRKTVAYTDKLKVDGAKCVGCGGCVSLCPMGNLALAQGKAVSHGRCTMCYRCIAHCPTQAITLLGKEIVEQSVIEKYI